MHILRSVKVREACESSAIRIFSRENQTDFNLHLENRLAQLQLFILLIAIIKDYEDI